MSYFLPFVEIHAVDHCNHTCRWCHNYSPNAPKREYKAKDYFEGLDILFRNNVLVNTISLMGGEPFLHSDLVGLAGDFITRYRRPLVLTSNGFWLSEDNIHAHKDLWPLLYFLKISRYPSIESRLGGEANILPLFELIRSYNPQIEIEWPDKYKFNELKFFAEPREPQVYCGNSTCLALVNRPDGPALGRCGAGAYAHLAPEDLLPQGFLNSEHMFYPLRRFETESFREWHLRHPLDACAYCNFAQLDRSVTWKAAKGMGLFVNEYEDEFEKKQCVYFLTANDGARLEKKLAALLKRNAAHADFANTLGVYLHEEGDPDAAIRMFALILRHVPGNAAAGNNLAAAHREKNA